MSSRAEQVVADATLSKSQRAFHWIKGKIAAGDFTPGYRLVLGTIAGELDMSVVPVREAIRQLEAEGLVTFEKNVGARVSMVDDTAYRYSMQALCLMEGTATALAARHLTREDIAHARAINTRMIESLASFDPATFTRLNHEFHAALYSKCVNPRVRELVESEWTRLAHLRDSTFSFVPDRARESVQEHETIIKLIENEAPLGEIEKVTRRHRSATLDAYIIHEHPDEAIGIASL